MVPPNSTETVVKHVLYSIQYPQDISNHAQERAPSVGSPPTVPGMGSGHYQRHQQKY